MLTAEEAQQQLSDLSLEDIGEMYSGVHLPEPDLNLKTFYLARLCAQGKTEQIERFIAETDPEEFKRIVNNNPQELAGGTVLHQTLYWNTGIPAVYIFQLLVCHGAQYQQDHGGHFPWELKGRLWIDITTGDDVGDRDPEEFNDTLMFIRLIYGVDEYSVGQEDTEGVFEVELSA